MFEGSFGLVMVLPGVGVLRWEGYSTAALAGLPGKNSTYDDLAT